ncbi:hypothetical protein [Parafilimonas sp.]|uniref:hypothetical protein n=1 Tax=Parafilimonas sp. TaxID=1969739 RepID=UPI0039E4D348
MKKTNILFLGVVIVLASCGGSAGWQQPQRDKLISECKEKAIATMSASGQTPDGATKQKLVGYCTCYQQNLEKKFPDPDAMGKADAGDVANAAKDCLELMVK